MLSPSPRVCARLGAGTPHEYDASSGSIILKPAHVEGSLSWSGMRESAVIALRQDALQELAKVEFGSANVELEPPPVGTVDQTALCIVQLLKVELTRGDRASEFYIDALIAMFGIHLLRTYASWKEGSREPKGGGLTARGARIVQDYLGENFTRKVSVKELAAVAGLSPKHFIQAFTRTFGAAPHRYLLDLRLDFAERLLIKGNMTVAEVAYLSGFSSQSHLTSAMKQYRHITPTRLRLAS